MQISTPDLCDKYSDILQIGDPIFTHFGGNQSFCGSIVTVKCFEDNSKVRELVAEDGSGKVMVVDAGGSLRCACLGDMLAEKAMNNQWQGVIMYGCVRDVELMANMSIGIMALAPHPLKSIKKGQGDVNIPVRFAGITFHPDHYIYADGNGIVVSEQSLLS